MEFLNRETCCALMGRAVPQTGRAAAHCKGTTTPDVHLIVVFSPITHTRGLLAVLLSVHTAPKRISE